MSVFPRQIDHESFRFRPPEEITANHLDFKDGFTLIYAGRVSKDKNLEFLIDVYRELQQLNSRINLAVIGDGPYLNEMEKLLPANEQVVYTGRVDYEDLPDYYSQGHALIFPSVTDTFGMVVLEAQCCELPAIVSDRGGPQEIVIDQKTGYVVQALQKGLWVKQIQDLIDLRHQDLNEYHKLRKNARLKALERFGWDVVLKQLTSEELLPMPPSLL